MRFSRTAQSAYRKLWLTVTSSPPRTSACVALLHLARTGTGKFSKNINQRRTTSPHPDALTKMFSASHVRATKYV